MLDNRGNAAGLTLVLHFDGSCWPNPGGMPSYGWHVDIEDGDRIADGTGTYPMLDPAHCTNNTAEWAGLRAGLMWLSKFRLPIDALYIRGDSYLVVNVINGEWRSKKGHLTRLRDECKGLLRLIEAGHIEVSWVPRELNATADVLSKS